MDSKRLELNSKTAHPDYLENPVTGISAPQWLAEFREDLARHHRMSGRIYEKLVDKGTAPILFGAIEAHCDKLAESRYRISSKIGQPNEKVLKPLSQWMGGLDSSVYATTTSEAKVATIARSLQSLTRKLQSQLKEKRSQVDRETYLMLRDIRRMLHNDLTMMKYWMN